MQPEMEKQNKKSFFSFTGAKRFLPLLFLLILTVVLMIFFKQKKPIFGHRHRAATVASPNKAISVA